MHDEYLRVLSNAARTVVVSVDYRLAPKHLFPAGFDDCVAAWSWLTATPTAITADTSRVAVAGDSAGGTLAFALALRARDEGMQLPRAVLAAYGTVEMRLSNPDLETALLTGAACEWFWDMYAPDPASRSDVYCNVANATNFWRASLPTS